MTPIEQRSCPDCGMIMGFDTQDSVYSCVDPDCGYVEYLEGEEPEQAEEEEEFRCPHCQKEIPEELLP